MCNLIRRKYAVDMFSLHDDLSPKVKLCADLSCFQQQLIYSAGLLTPFFCLLPIFSRLLTQSFLRVPLSTRETKAIWKEHVRNKKEREGGREREKVEEGVCPEIFFFLSPT